MDFFDAVEKAGVDVVPPLKPDYWEHGDFEADGILICGMCGKPKEIVYQNGVKFPIIHEHQLERICQKEPDPLEIVQRKERWRRACFAGEFRMLEDECRLSKADADTQPEALEAIDVFKRTMFENKTKKMGRGLIIYGFNGRGKTFIAGCLCNELLDKGYRILMTSTRRLRNQADEKFGSLNSIIEWLVKFDAVCLDDLFADKSTDTGREFMFNIVDALYKMRVPMIVTTNMSREYLMNPSDSDKPTIDRLKERCDKLELIGRNRRQGRL